MVSYAITEHAEFRKYKYYPLDPEFVDSKKKESAEYRSLIIDNNLLQQSTGH